MCYVVAWEFNFHALLKKMCECRAAAMRKFLVDLRRLNEMASYLALLKYVAFLY